MLKDRIDFVVGTFIGSGLGLFSITLSSIMNGPYNSAEVLIIANSMLLFSLAITILFKK